MEKSYQNQAENECECGADHRCRCYRTAHGVEVVGAETLRCDDGQAAGKADGDGNKKKKQRAGRTDGSQRIYAKQTADNDDVGNAVKLLKDVAD